MKKKRLGMQTIKTIRVANNKTDMVANNKTDRVANDKTDRVANNKKKCTLTSLVSSSSSSQLT